MKNIFGLMGMLGLVCLAAASGCGSDGGTTPGNAAGYQDKGQGTNGGNCSQQLIDDANTIRQAALGMENNATADSLNQLKAQVQAFKNKYDGVVCKAQDHETGKAVTVDINAVTTQWLNAIDQALQQLNGGGNHAGAGGPFGGVDADVQAEPFTSVFPAFDIF